jgi:hypothetical protein
MMSSNRWRLLALAVAAKVALLSCTSTEPTTVVKPLVPPATGGDKVAVTAQQQPVKPQHECVGNSELSQYYVVEPARLEGEPSGNCGNHVLEEMLR